MRFPKYHGPLTCSDLNLDQEKLGDEYTDAQGRLLRLLTLHFGRAQVRAALGDGLESGLHEALHAFAQGIAGVISSAYVHEALAKTREATANMFEALAAGARVADQDSRAGEPAGQVVHALAVIAACEGRPAILALENAERCPAAPSKASP